MAEDVIAAVIAVVVGVVVVETVLQLIVEKDSDAEIAVTVGAGRCLFGTCCLKLPLPGQPFKGKGGRGKRGRVGVCGIKKRKKSLED